METNPSCLYLSAFNGTSMAQVQRKLPAFWKLLFWKKEWVHSHVVLPSAHRWPQPSRHSSSVLSDLKLQLARWGYLRSSSLCHQRLKVGSGWCKAELQDFYQQGTCTACPVLLEPLWDLFWALWGRHCLASHCRGPATTHSSQNSPVSLPLRPQFL